MYLNFYVINIIWKNFNNISFKTLYQKYNFFLLLKLYKNYILNFYIKQKFNFFSVFFVLNFYALILFEINLNNIYFKVFNSTFFFKGFSRIYLYALFKIKIDIISFFLLFQLVEYFRRVKYNEYICNGNFLSSKLISGLVKPFYFQDILIGQIWSIKFMYYNNFYNKSYLIFYFNYFSNVLSLSVSKFYLSLLTKFQLSFIYIKNHCNILLQWFLLFFSKFYFIYFFYKFLMFRGNFASFKFLSRLKYYNYKNVYKFNTNFSWYIRIFRFYLYLKNNFFKHYNCRKKQFLLDFYNYTNINKIDLIQYRFNYKIISLLFITFFKNYYEKFLYEYLAYDLKIFKFLKIFHTLIIYKFINLKSQFFKDILYDMDLILWDIYESDIYKNFYMNKLSVLNYYRKLDFDNLFNSRVFFFFYYIRINLKLKKVYNNFNILFLIYIFNSLFLLGLKDSLKFYFIQDKVILLEFFFKVIMFNFLNNYYNFYIDQNFLIYKYD